MRCEKGITVERALAARAAKRPARRATLVAFTALLLIHCGTSSDPNEPPRGNGGAGIDAVAPPPDADPWMDVPSFDATPADAPALDEPSPPADDALSDTAPPDVAVPSDVAVPDPDAPMSHRFLHGFADSGLMHIVRKDGSIEWEYDPGGNEANDAWMLPNGNVLFAYKTPKGVRSGAREVTLAKQTVWEYTAPAGSEVHAVQLLPGDQYLVGESHDDGTSTIYEMDRSNKVLHFINVHNGGTKHDQFREVRKTPQGTYLTTQERAGDHGMEFDANGKLLRTFPCGWFSIIRLPDGNTLLGCGNDHRVVEVDADNKVVWEITQHELPGITLQFVAGLQRLANGNTVVCNWGAQTQILEVTRGKKVVWQVKNPQLGGVSNIHILDPEAAVGGVALR
jgi:hypothetical protein